MLFLLNTKYMYIYVCICVRVYVYIYVYIHTLSYKYIIHICVCVRVRGLCIYIDIHNKISTLYSFRTACNIQQKYNTKTSCMSKKSTKVSNKNKQGMLVCNLSVCIYKFKTKTTLQIGTWEVVKIVVISLNSLKMEDQPVFFFIKNLIIY